jgi:hypothetical protein
LPTVVADKTGCVLGNYSIQLCEKKQLGLFMRLYRETIFINKERGLQKWLKNITFPLPQARGLLFANIVGLLRWTPIISARFRARAQRRTGAASKDQNRLHSVITKSTMSGGNAANVGKLL